MKYLSLFPEKIDQDLVTSKKLVENLQKANIAIEPIVDKKKIDKKEHPPIDNNTHFSTTNQWPDFQNRDPLLRDANWVPTHKSYPPKTFAYHRVTGRPLYLNKNPKAYIAVSVIAQKSTRAKESDDSTLEKELRQLKPWTHSQNLENMANIRSKWGVQNGGGKAGA